MTSHEAARTARRQALALALLPALVAAAAYLLVLRPRAVREVEASQTRLAETRAQTPGAAVLSQQLEELGELRTQVEAARAARAAEGEPQAAAPVSGEGRAARRLLLADILERHELTLVEEEVGDMDVGPQLLPALGERHAGRRRIPVVTLRLTGRYLDVLAALRALQGPELGAVPLRLELAPLTPGARLQHWTLVLA